MDKGKGPCDNCCGEHYYPYCPHPHDKAEKKKSKEEHAARRGCGGRNGGRGGGRGDGLQGDRKKWSKNKRDGYINDYGNDVQKRGNACM